MPTFNFSVENKIVSHVGTNPHYVHGNTDYEVVVSFDEEWAGLVTFTARIRWVDHGLLEYRDIVFTGDSFNLPALYDMDYLEIGFFAGNKHTTTPAIIICDHSILDYDPTIDIPDPDVYAQILDLIQEGAVHGMSPYIGTNLHWYTWDDDQRAFVDTGITARGEVTIHAPYIGGNGNWYQFDASTETYIDTEVHAEGPQGTQGPKGDPGSPGAYITYGAGLEDVADGIDMFVSWSVLVPEPSTANPPTVGAIILFTQNSTVGKIVSVSTASRLVSVEYMSSYKGETGERGAKGHPGIYTNSDIEMVEDLTLVDVAWSELSPSPTLWDPPVVGDLVIFSATSAIGVITAVRPTTISGPKFDVTYRSSLIGETGPQGPKGDSDGTRIYASEVRGKTLDEIFSEYNELVLDEDITIGTQTCHYDVKITGNHTIYINGVYPDNVNFDKTLTLTGVKITKATSASSSGGLINCGDAIFDGCEIYGAVRVTVVRNIDRFVFRNCYFHDIEMSFFLLEDWAYNLVLFENNTVKTFKHCFLHMGMTNGSGVDRSTRRMFVARGNFVDGGPTVHYESEGSTHAFLLCEGNVAHLLDNVIKNITDDLGSDKNTGNPTYSFYLSSDDALVQGNHISNCHSGGWKYNVFLKAKGGGGIKRFVNNVFEDDNCCRLLNITSAGTWVIDNCDFHFNKCEKFSPSGNFTGTIVRNCRFFFEHEVNFATNIAGMTFDNCEFRYKEHTGITDLVATGDSAHTGRLQNSAIIWDGTGSIPNRSVNINSPNVKNISHNAWLQLYPTAGADVSDVFAQKVQFGTLTAGGECHVRNVRCIELYPITTTFYVGTTIKVRDEDTGEEDAIKITKSEDVMLFNGNPAPYSGTIFRVIAGSANISIQAAKQNDLKNISVFGTAAPKV